jgi:hypothetical protein
MTQSKQVIAEKFANIENAVGVYVVRQTTTTKKKKEYPRVSKRLT